MFNKPNQTCGSEIIKEGHESILKINCESCNFSPSIEDNTICMARTIDKLIQTPNIARIIFSQKRNYTYSYEQTQLLKEVANIYNHLIKQKKIINVTALGPLQYSRDYTSKFANIEYLTLNQLRNDPIGAYVDTKRLIREQKIFMSKIENEKELTIEKSYLEILLYIFNLLDKTKLITLAKPSLAGLKVGSRGIYRTIFRPTITPNFMLTRLMAQPPLDGEEVDAYSINKDTEVMIFKTQDDLKYLYHLHPPEFKISEDKYELIDLARSVLAEHKPRAEEFIDPSRMRQTFFHIGRDLITELAAHKNINIKFDEIELLARILVRYTVGFGLLEVLLQDEKIQDITINGPIGQTPIFIVHRDFDECVTNIIPSKDDGDSWATKFRLLSGRPLDEANPVLDTNLTIPGARARVAIISNPLNPLGLAYALRRHREQPWTLPLFIQNRMINSTAAGLMSFLIDGSRSLLIAGTRSSGKTSFLVANMIEIMRKYRLITVEDTLELPTNAFRKLGYNIQPMKVRAALTSTGTEMSAEEGIRTSLRMGDSSLIVGEVRSKEALALYEAMRVGALANVVAGTIHGDSPYGVFDRVVNDLGVPRTSFKATDIIVVANPVKSSDGLHKNRRVVSITEVRKEWEEDPLRENAFVDLMTYDTKKDELILTNNLLNGESEIIKKIASSIKDWAGNWDAVWENILLRGKIKKTLVDIADRSHQQSLLEAEFVVKSNDQFHRISDSVRTDIGFPDPKRIFFEWSSWLKKEVKKLTIKA